MDDDLMLAADWSELLEDLLGLIKDELNKSTFVLLDYIRFGAVCNGWRSFCIQNYEHIKLPSNLPVLMIPSPFYEDYNNEDNDQGEQDILHDDYDNQDDEGEQEQEQDFYEDYNNEDNDQGEQDILHDDYDNQDDEGEQEHEQLEMPVNLYYYDDEQEPSVDYYKPKDIWKGQDETRHKSSRSFYSLSDRKVYQDFQLAVPYYKNCRGSSYGWLITVDVEEQPDGSYTYPVRLLNPFRSVNSEIQLPPLTTITFFRLGQLQDCEPTGSDFLIKAFLSDNPSSLSNLGDLIVFGVLGPYQLGFCRPGDKAWTHFPLENQFRPIEDLICYKGRFLAVIQVGSVLELDFPHPNVKLVARTPTDVDKQKYLVESAGDLLQVQREVFQEEGDDDYSTIGFRVFKLNDDANAADDEWFEMDNLDGRILFLGNNRSISLSATDFPGLMPNCIYFTDENFEYYDAGPGPRDFGVFNFVDKSVVSNFGDKSLARHYATRKNIMPPPIWIQPML